MNLNSFRARLARRRALPPARLLRSIERSLASLAETEALRLKLALIEANTTREWLEAAEFVPGEASQEDARGERASSEEEPLALNLTTEEIDRIGRTAPGSLEEKLALEQIRAAHGVGAEVAAEAAVGGLGERAAKLVEVLAARIWGREKKKEEAPARASAEVVEGAAPREVIEPPRTRPVEDGLPLLVVEEDPEEARARWTLAYRKAVGQEMREEGRDA